MAVPKELVTDAELQVLKLLWVTQPMTARQLTGSLYGEPTPSNIGTVQKLVQRLEAKGCIKRDRSAHVHRFSAKVTQAAVAGKQMEALAEKVSDGSFAPFITHLVQSKRLSKSEKEEIRRLLEN